MPEPGVVPKKLTAFLLWYYDFGDWGRKGDKTPSEDAPTMEEDDVMAWNFYGRTATAFVRDFGLMPTRLSDSGYEGVAKDILMDKLTAIHDMVLRKGLEKKNEPDPATLIEGNENG